MALWLIPGQGIVDDAQEGISIPEPGEIVLPNGEKITWGVAGTQRLPEYRNTWQYGQDAYQWDPTNYGAGQGPSGSYNVGYIPQLIDWAGMAELGTLQPYEREQYAQMVQAARAIPTRDISQLQAGYPGEDGDLSRYLTPASPDAGAVMLTLRDKIMQGQASDQERGLYDSFLAQMREQNYRASVPQPSDVFNPLGDQFFGALGTLALGATGGLAAAPLAAGGAGLATTLGSLGTLAGVAGTGAGILGSAIDAPWLQKLGLGLGIAGGLAGGVGGLANLWGTGIGSVGDAARLASSAGKVTGALGRIPGADPLKQASRYLGLAGSLGQGASGVQGLLGAAQGVQQGATQAATQAATDTGGRMAEWNYDDFLGWGGNEAQQDWYTPQTMDWSDSPGFQQAYADFLGGGGDETQMPWYQAADLDTSGGGGGWLSSVLGALGSVGGFLGKNASVLGPAASALGSLGGGLLGSQASNEAARLQAAALNRGLDLQQAAWLQNIARTAPWVEAGQTALGHYAGRSTWDQPTLQQVGPISGANYALPSTTPGWTPQAYQGPAAIDAGAYRYMPGQGPRAGDYRYTPGQTPDAAQYVSGPPQLYQGPMPGTQVPTLSGQQLLNQDPGVQFRLEEGRRALEASAAARGGALSGPALAALQRQGQELSGQEYQNAWQRMMAANTEQYGRTWNQYLQNWNQGVTGTQLGLQTQAQNFGQAMSAAQLREQVNQVASQQGWSQAQAEAAFREQLAQQASSQGFAQALQGQGQAWNQGLQASQYNQQQQAAWQNQLYQQMMEQAKLRYGQDWQAQEAMNQRLMDQYNAQRQGQATSMGYFSTLAQLGLNATGSLGTQGLTAAQQQSSLLGQLGSAQGIGQLGSAYNWNQALGGGATAFGNLLKGLNA